MSVRDIITRVLEAEGSAYTNDPKDRGGPTRYGITLDALSDYRGKKCTADDVKALTEDEARAIYHEKYVVKPGFSNLLFLSPRVGEEVIDTGVNCGPVRAALWLQEELNLLNREGADYADIPEDGDCGPGTIRALKAFLAKRGKDGEDVLVVGLNVAQGQHYRSLARRNPSQERFYLGWLKNRVAL
jgi:lysozyme family protein